MCWTTREENETVNPLSEPLSPPEGRGRAGASPGGVGGPQLGASHLHSKSRALKEDTLVKFLFLPYACYRIVDCASVLCSSIVCIIKKIFWGGDYNLSNSHCLV